MTVVPLSGNIERVYPFEVAVSRNAGLHQDFKAMANQIRTVSIISKKRQLRPPDKLPDEIMNTIDDAILLHLGIER